MAALYVHCSGQSAFVIRTLEDRIAYVESYGEESYGQSMRPGSSSESSWSDRMLTDRRLY